MSDSKSRLPHPPIVIKKPNTYLVRHLIEQTIQNEAGEKKRKTRFDLNGVVKKPGVGWFGLLVSVSMPNAFNAAGPADHT